MEFSSSAATGRRAAMARSGAFRNFVFLLFGLLALAWNSTAFAQSCDIDFGTTSATGNAGSSLTFTFTVRVSACSGNTADGTITFTDNTGGATVTPLGTFSVAHGASQNITVNMGPLTGRTGTIDVTCDQGASCTGAYTYATFSDFNFVAAIPTDTNVIQGKPFEVSTLLELDGAASPLGAYDIVFSRGPTTRPTDAAGIATYTETINTPPGLYNVQAAVDCGRIPPPDCAAQPILTFPVRVEHPSVSTNPTPINIYTGETANLEVLYDGDDTGVFAPDGTTMNWSFPAAPGASLTGSNVAGGAGRATAAFTATNPGTYVVSAFSGCTFCGANQSVTITVVVVRRDLAVVSGDTQTSNVGTAFPADLVVNASNFDGAASDNVSGVNILWTVTSTATATLGTSSPTDVNGLSRIQVTPTSPGTITIRAARADDPTVFVDFNNLTAVAAPVTMTPVTPDPANTFVGVAQTFTVDLDQFGAPLTGAAVTWTTSGPFTFSGPPSVSGLNGEANISVTPTATATCLNCVTASVDPDGLPLSGDEASYAFDVTARGTPTLVIAGGNGSSVQAGQQFPQLSVRAANGGTTPVPVVTIDWAVVSGPGTVTPPNGTTDPTGGVATATATAGATAGTLVISATRRDVPSQSVTFNLTVTAVGTAVTPVTADPADIDVGVPAPFTVNVTQGGVTPPAPVTVTWTSTAGITIVGGPTSPTDGSGRATINVRGDVAGSYPAGVTASIDPDGIPLSGDESSHSFAVDVANVPGLTINGGQGQAGTVGTNFAQVLSVIADDSGAPAGGIGINWAVTGGAATITPSGNTDTTTGEAHLSVVPTAPGTLTITATRADAPTVTVTFNLTATAAATTTTAVSPNPAQMDVGVAATFTVHVARGGSGLANVPVEWTAAPGFILTKLATTTDTNGDSSVVLTANNPGNVANALVVAVDPDGIAGSGDESGLTFSTQAITVPEMVIASGNGQSALPGFAFTNPLEVTVSDSGTPTVNLPVVWTSTGGVTVTPSGNTDAAGKAAATVVAGSTSGPATVTATRSDDPSVAVTFNLTVSQFGTLTITGGDGQVLSTGQPSDPLEVTLEDENGAAIAGATVSWATSAGTLASATSTTNASGIATNTVTVSVPGAVEVTATSPLAADPAVFALNGDLANLVGLDPVERQIAEALDSLCPELGSMATLSPEQADLLARCEELRDAAGIDPAATVVAIDQLMSHLVLAQGEASLMAAQAQFQNLKTRIAALRAGTVGASFGGLALNTSTGPVSMETLAGAFSAAEDPTAPADGTEIGGDFSRWGFFAAGNIGRGEHEDGSLDPNFDYDIDGITLGVDYRYSDRLIFGASYGYTRQDTELQDGSGDVETTGWSLSAYSTYYQADTWYVDGVFTWGRNDFELMRRIEYTVPTAGGGTSTIAQEARSDSSGDLLSAAFTFGRDFNRGAMGIGPYARLLYTRLTFDELNEELLPGLPGSGLGLSIDERELTSLASVFGTKFTYTYSTDWGVLIPHLQLEWEHEFHDDPQSMEARFLHDPTSTPIIIEGDRFDTDFFRLGLGMSMVLTKGRSGFFYFEQTFGRDGASQYNLALGLRLEF